MSVSAEDLKRLEIMYQLILDLDKVLQQLLEGFNSLEQGSEQHRKTWVKLKIAKTHLRCLEDKFDELIRSLFDCPAHRLRYMFWDYIPNFTLRKWGNSCGVRNSTNTCCPPDHLEEMSSRFAIWYASTC